MFRPTSNTKGVRLSFAVAALLIFCLGQAAQADPLVVTTTNSATTLANTLLAANSGITVTGATYTGAASASGTFTGGTGVIGFESGIVLTSGNATFVVGPNNATGSGVNNGAPGTPLISNSFNASILTITFIPTSSNVEFSYVFGSEEYNEFVNSQFNDAFRFLVNGTNYALIPGTNIPVEINTINNGFAPSGSVATGPCMNCQYYLDNANGIRNTQLDGTTVVLSFIAPVTPGVENTLQLVIADRGDPSLDSAVFLQGGSFISCGGPGQPPCGGPDPIPEPTTMLLLGTGLAGVAAKIRKRNKAKKNL